MDKLHTDAQPRRGLQELIPEFESVQTISDATADEIALAARAKVDRKLVARFRHLWLGKEARIIAIRSSSGGFTSASPPSSAASEGQPPSTQIIIGVSRSVEQFTHLALDLVHPFDRPVRYPPRVADALSKLASSGPEGVIEMRKQQMARIRQMRIALADAERECKDELNCDVRAVLGNKQVILFRDLLAEINYDDMGVVETLQKGIPIVGNLAGTGIWRPLPSPPTISQETLWANAKSTRRAIHALGPPEFKDELWRSTIEERDAGGIRGPYSEHELSSRLGPLWVPARRFGVQQGVKVDADGATVPKIRAVDNFSLPGTNSAFGADEKVSMLGLEQVVGWARGRAESLAERDGALFLDIQDVSDARCYVPPHPGWTKESWSNLQGKVADLKSAYKQLPSHPMHRSFNVIAAFCPDEEAYKFLSA